MTFSHKNEEQEFFLQILPKSQERGEQMGKRSLHTLRYRPMNIVVVVAAVVAVVAVVAAVCSWSAPCYRFSLPSSGC